MGEPDQANWHSYLIDLERWHSSGAGDVSRALESIRREAGTWFPPAVRNRWSTAEREDAVSSFIERLLARPLPASTPGNARAYLRECFRNHCISIERHRRSRPADLSEEPALAAEPVSFAEAASHAQEVESAQVDRLSRERVVAAFDRLGAEDAMALKLLAAPERLTASELEQLAERVGSSREEVISRIRRATSSYELTLLFDPPDGDEPNDTETRRRRLERYRRRCNRARDTLHRLLGEES